jgi:hypothetical protein
MANHSDELRWRRQAIRLRLKGKRPCQIGKRIPRNREWLRKWWLRFTQQGWQGLHERSRRPHTSPQAYSEHARSVVIAVRQALEHRQVGLIGPRAIGREIQSQRLLPKVPSLATIKRILKHAGITSPAHLLPLAYYPQPERPVAAVWQACDWLARYLPGGTKLFVFHTLDLHTHALAQTIRTDKTVASVRAHLLETWQTLGLPDRLQLDNDAAFSGGERTARRFGSIVRLCLYVGIEILFLPPREPKRNGVVERVNGLWVRQFWERNHFADLCEVLKEQAVFLDWYGHEYTPPSLGGRTVAQAQRTLKRRRLGKQAVRDIPAVVPITEGRVHFVRKVKDDGTIHLLGESWKISRRLAHQYVWATIQVGCGRLEVYHQRSKRAKFRRVKTFDYRLPEKVVLLRQEFKR